MSETINLKDDRLVGENQPCYIIAEMSANHAGSFERAKEIIHAANDAGVDCVKIQTYRADTLTIDSEKEYFKIEEGIWEGENLYSLYQNAYTPWDWQAKLKKEAEKLGLDFFSTPYDKTAVDFLEDLGVDFYKVASFEIIDIPLIRYIAATGKPIIMSTGMATLGEVEEAVKTVREEGNDNLALLKCSSAYPAVPEDMNLKTIEHLSETFDLPVGLSDHSFGSVGAIAGVAIGAKIVEKHLCLSREIENPDASFSMEPDEFKKMVEDIRATEQALGEIDYDISEREETSRELRKSIFAVDDIKAGEEFTEKNTRAIRPGHGLKPKYLPEVLTKKATRDIEKGEPLSWSMVG